MSRRRRTSPLEDLVELASLLPYWVSLIIAVIAYFFFHSYAASDVQPVIQPGSAVPQNMGGMMFRTFATFLQYLVPFAFVLGALGSAFKTFKGKQLAKQYTQYESSPDTHVQAQACSGGSKREPKPTDEMNWQQFELLVGEAFNKQGYRVIHGGDAGADGGVDVHLRKEGKEYLVQCKHWKTRKVGVAVIRELYGVMAAVGAEGGFIVTSGEFTEEAEAFSEGKALTLISGDELSRMLGRAVQGSSEAVVAAKVKPAVIHCPKCSSPMVKRVAKRGQNAGNEFWGCSQYPKCRGIVKL
jgi:restriction system protein